MSVKLNMMERFHLLNLLPMQGDYITLKIMRKLRESLAPDEKEIEEYQFWREWACSHKSYIEEGAKVVCEYTEESATQPKCPFHDKVCTDTGKLFWRDEVKDKVKEIWLGGKARDLIVEALKLLEDDKRLSEEDGTANLYEKFIPEEEE
jgi:hypothetical protein